MTITMTEAQTETYDADGIEAVELVRKLVERARWTANETGSHVTIYTADGIVVEIVGGGD